jgi:hypothetical protein
VHQISRGEETSLRGRIDTPELPRSGFVQVSLAGKPWTIQSKRRSTGGGRQGSRSIHQLTPRISLRWRASSGRLFPDNHEVSFWSIDRLLSENDTRAGVDDRGEYRDIAFADFMIDSWRFFLRLRSNGAVSVYAEEGGPAATSLSDFFTRYLSDPCPYPV